MSLYLVGETTDRTKAFQQAEKGQWIQLLRGIYIDSADDVEATVMSHAVRIARYLYPNTYLSAASAGLLAPTREGKLFLSGRRAQRTRVRGLEIVQNRAPAKPSLGAALVADDLGEFNVQISSLRLRLLESFRLRSEHAASVDVSMREAFAVRLVEEYGSAQGAADAVWALARDNEWYREGESAERFLKRQPMQATPENAAGFKLVIAWHGRTIGQLANDGFEWRWTPDQASAPALVRQTVPGRLPPFIVSLLPEGWLDKVLAEPDDRTTLRHGRRYMSNITMSENPAELDALARDVLRERLERHTSAGAFTGTYAGPVRTDLDQSFERNLARIFSNAETPRLSGVQIKAPMHLDARGMLQAAVLLSFTHILKPAGRSGFESLPLVEWTALALGRAAGFEVPAFALLDMPHGMPPALLVERFDIRNGTADEERIAMEDLCSVLDLPPSAKYDGTIERVANAVRALSTSPLEDVTLVFKRALFAWLIADGDMHLKNMAMLKRAAPGSAVFNTVRFAPLYDAVCTRLFPDLKHDHMALKLQGKDERLRRADFAALGRTIGMRAGDADRAMDSLIADLRSGLEAFALPQLKALEPDGQSMVGQMLTMCRDRVAKFE